MDITGLPSGTVYPALRRMEETGFVESNWEKEGVAQNAGRPPRKYYVVTETGRIALNDAVGRYRFMERLLPGTAGEDKPSRQQS
jgi:PadR family transcriptional regulator PadR